MEAVAEWVRTESNSQSCKCNNSSNPTSNHQSSSHSFLSLLSSGYKVITACSPHNFALVKSLGATEAFDYNDPDCAKKIREYTHNTLTLCWDTIGLPATAELCANALSSNGEGGSGKLKYGSITNSTCPREEVVSTRTLAYTATGEAFEFGPPIGMVPAIEEDFEFGKKWVGEWEKAFVEKTVKASEPLIGEGGLKGAIQGMKDVKNGKNSGVRLAFRVEEAA
jgi:hypothetical protein